MTYITAADVRTATGVQFDDLGFPTDTELDDWLDARIAEIANQIDVYCNVTFGTPGPPPLGINAVALLWARNLVAIALASRQSPLVRVDDWHVQIADPKVFTEDLMEQLDHYRAGLRIGMRRVRSVAEQAADEAEA